MPDKDLKISISAKSLLELIKCLEASKVSEFRYKDLHIVFNRPQEPQQNFYPSVQNTSATGSSLSLPGEDLKSEEQVEADRLEELLITDPLAYEEAQNERLSRFEEQAQNN